MGTSGPNIPDSQRHTVKMQLRLPPDAARELRRLAKKRDENMSAIVAELVMKEVKRGA